jgi:NHS family xanthosine MFS transporter
VSQLGLDACGLFKQPVLAKFLIFTTLIGGCLQLTNAYGDTFLHDFAKNPAYADSLAVRYPAMLMSISQMSETVFILAIPYLYTRYGIKVCLTMSLVAWCLRFGIFAIANPTDRLWLLVLSCLIYGPAFDFFLISGALFIDAEVSRSLRASAQGLFGTMVGGVGSLMGNLVAGLVIELFFQDADGRFNWPGIWLSFAGYALVVTVLFLLFFQPPVRTGPVEVDASIPSHS